MAEAGKKGKGASGPGYFGKQSSNKPVTAPNTATLPA
jgi:hypothetical protein